MSRSNWPERGTVHCWLESLPRILQENDRHERLLSPDEHGRADRLLSREARERFVAGRGFLRETLAGYCNKAPESIGFSAGKWGKPFLAEAEDERLHFNLSHSGELILLAVSIDDEVGVDLEQIRPDLPYKQIARRFFSPGENDELATLPPSDQLNAFYRCWTRKEAWLKGCGCGFSQPSVSRDIPLLPDCPSVRIEAESSCWHVRDLPVPEGYCAAMALAGEIMGITNQPENSVSHVLNTYSGQMT